MTAWIARAALREIRGDCRTRAPEEACGLLLGRDSRIEAAVAARNLASDRLRQFEIDPAVLFAAHRAARSGGPAILGCYHSHPRGPAIPSATDAARALDLGWLWLIVGGQEQKAYRVAADGPIVGRFVHCALITGD